MANLSEKQIAAIARIILGDRPDGGWTLGEVQDAIDRAGLLLDTPMWSDFRTKVWHEMNSGFEASTDGYEIRFNEKEIQPSEDPRVKELITFIAKKILRLDTLETRKNDKLDFHNISVWSIRAALESAFRVGQFTRTHRG